ncbi:hypothetical protein AB0H36_05110 [Kribbella sp. NPDC050820]|uniref:hypothetical protein n=1 Tax=Kribbella sp. NPDC050820 TaxID=3155408 RepID=UPI00340463C8
MESTPEALAKLGEHFTANGMKPPLEVMQCLAALIDDADVTQAVASYTQEGEPKSPDERVTWECLALVNGSVIGVRASRPGRDWFWGAPAWTVKGKATVFGDLIPLSEVAGCRLIGHEGESGETEWLTRWQLQLKIGDSLAIPWPVREWNGRVRHEELARAIAKNLR